MNKLFILIFAIISLSVVSCSQCYECTSESTATDGNGNVIEDSLSVSQDICTSSSEEIKEMEDDGAICRVK